MVNLAKRLVASAGTKARCLITTIRKELMPLRRVNAFAEDLQVRLKRFKKER